jgi:predicted nucleotidyltransferase
MNPADICVLASQVMVDVLGAVDARRLTELCRRHGIRSLALYGSALRGELRPDSDIDLLVEFEAGRVPGLIRLGGIQNEFAELFGREVDLRTAEDLSRYFRADVVQRAEVFFAAA